MQRQAALLPVHIDTLQLRHYLRTGGGRLAPWARERSQGVCHQPPPVLLAPCMCLCAMCAMVDWHVQTGCPSQTEIREKLARMYDVSDQNCIFVFQFRTQVRVQLTVCSFVLKL